MTVPEPIGIVGAGPVACAIGRLLTEAGAPSVVVASRTPGRAADAVAFIGPSARAAKLSELARAVDRVIIATTDAAIGPVAEALASAGFHAGLALHTSGARGRDALAPLSAAGVSCGVLHPFQTIASPDRGVLALRGATFRVEGDPEALAWARRIARQLGGRAIEIDSAQLPVYHAAAVLAGNAVTALVDAALRLLESAGVDRAAALDAVASLGHATLENSVRLGPAAALTGPVARGDAATVGAHVAALEARAPDLTALYDAVSWRLLDIAARRGLPAEQLVRVAAALDAPIAGERDER